MPVSDVHGVGDRLAVDEDGWRAVFRSDGLYLLSAPHDGPFALASTLPEAVYKLVAAVAEGRWR